MVESSLQAVFYSTALTWDKPGVTDVSNLLDTHNTTVKPQLDGVARLLVKHHKHDEVLLLLDLFAIVTTADTVTHCTAPVCKLVNVTWLEETQLAYKGINLDRCREQVLWQ